MINLLTQHKNIFKCSYYDYINPNVLSNGYTFKNNSDILSWRLTTEAVSSVIFTVILNETNYLKYIEVGTIGGAENAQIKIKIETSIDYANWYELKYVADSTKYGIRDEYTGKVEYVAYLKVSDTEYFNLTTKTMEGYNENFDYVYQSYNEYSKTFSPLNSSLEFKYLRITLLGTDLAGASVQDPISLTKMDIYSDDGISSSDNYTVELKSGIFTQQAIFEDQTFYPDMIRNYLAMMEDKTYKTNNLLTNLVDVSEFNLVGSSMEGIDFDFIEYDLVVYE